MQLYTSIARRKSCRSYDMNPLPKEMLAQIEAVIKEFPALYPERKLSYRFASKTKGRFGVSAPHYLVISGEGKPRELENAGFLFEHLALWLDSVGLGCVWLGGSKDVDMPDAKNDIIIIGFGKTEGSPHRPASAFKRKDIEKITNAPDDFCMQAVHLAPSGINLQPWFFEKTADSVLVYRQIIKPPVSLLYKKTELDMGIALCHYALACKEIDQSFSFAPDTCLPKKSGYVPFGILR